MSIETICEGCGRKLRVADEHAGRKARCPHCRTVYTVPQPSPPPDHPLGESPYGELPVDGWRLRTADGQQYGPVSKAEFDRWFAEGRITADMQVKREGDEAWQPATHVYPVPETPSAGWKPRAEQRQAAPVNPYAAPAGTTRRYVLPHNGGTILTLGILGLLCCQILAPIAWAMGRADMKKMREGQMDPAGQGITQAGLVLGIIGTVILIFSIGIQILAAAFG